MANEAPNGRSKAHLCENRRRRATNRAHRCGDHATWKQIAARRPTSSPRARRSPVRGHRSIWLSVGSAISAVLLWRAGLETGRHMPGPSGPVTSPSRTAPFATGRAADGRRRESDVRRRSVSARRIARDARVNTSESCSESPAKIAGRGAKTGGLFALSTARGVGCLPVVSVRTRETSRILRRGASTARTGIGCRGPGVAAALVEVAAAEYDASLAGISGEWVAL